ncbi:MAG: type IV pilus assembly protein PilM [Candidatus Moranbacteria bacterium]|nr:type IV pilus assembly protein PilM [Candidatus Moranbacteria bacterium]
MAFFTKKIINFSDDAFGLDINDLSVKIVQLKKTADSYEINGYGYASIPPGVVSGGEIIKKDILVSKIQEAITNSKPRKIKTKKVICSLPESKSFLRIISMPKLEEAEMAEAIKWEIEANIPLPLNRVYYDWQILDQKIQEGKTKDSVDVLVLASAKTVVGQFIEIIEAAGLEVINLEVESIAQARSLIREDDKSTSLIVDMGKENISFLFAVGNIPCFTSSIPLSLRSFDEAIAKEMSISAGEAEKIKINYGIGSVAKEDQIFRALRPILNSLVNEIEKSIDFYLNGLKYSKSVDKTIVCGGGANAKGIIPYLSKKLGREIILGNPWVNVEMEKGLPIINRDEIVRYTTPIGLAIKSGFEENR